MLPQNIGNAIDSGRMDAARMELDVSLDIQILIGRVRLFYWDYRQHAVIK
jgi:hypothetical protein